MIYFSKSTNGFFIETINPEMPDDAVEVSEETYNALMAGQQFGGKVIVSDENGYPVLITPEVNFIEAAEREREALIAEANAFINDRQWPSKLTLGRLDEDEKTRFNLWLDYLDELEQVDISTAPDIEWPVKPE